MNYFLSFLILLCIFIFFAIWICAVLVTIEDAQLWFYKTKEQQEIDSKYIEDSEVEKDKKLSEQLSEQNWPTDAKDYIND